MLRADVLHETAITHSTLYTCHCQIASKRPHNLSGCYCRYNSPNNIRTQAVTGQAACAHMLPKSWNIESYEHASRLTGRSIARRQTSRVCRPCFGLLRIVGLVGPILWLGC